MIRHIAAAVFLLPCLGAAGCGVPTSADVRPGSPPAAAAEVRPPAYRNVSTVSWAVGRDAQLEARLERLDVPLADAPATLPLARLTIKNLATGRTIHEQTSDDSPVSMCARDVNGDVGRALVLTWAGGSAERLEILAVDATRAQVIFNESYRVSASLVDLSGGDGVDILITTADSGAGPFYTTRFAWDGQKYRPSGRTLYEDFKRTMARQFGTRR